MSDDDENIGRTFHAPKDSDEWGEVWKTVDRMNRLWPLMKPFVSLKDSKLGLVIVGIMTAVLTSALTGGDALALLIDLIKGIL